MLGKQAKILAPLDVADLLAFADCSRQQPRKAAADWFRCTQNWPMPFPPGGKLALGQGTWCALNAAAR